MQLTGEKKEKDYLNFTNIKKTFKVIRLYPLRDCNPASLHGEVLMPSPIQQSEERSATAALKYSTIYSRKADIFCKSGDDNDCLVTSKCYV